MSRSGPGRPGRGGQGGAPRGGGARRGPHAAHTSGDERALHSDQEDDACDGDDGESWQCQGDLSRRLDAAEAAESASRFEEVRLREECAVAQAQLQQARSRQQRAREGAAECRRRLARSHEIVRSELNDLMQRIVAYEKEERDFTAHNAQWQAELDALVISQANAMARRDDLAVEAKRLEEMALASGARALDAEARVRKAEERNNKERERIQLLKQEARRMDVEDKTASHAHVQLLERRRRAGAALQAAAVWQNTAAALALAVGIAAAYQLAFPLPI